MPERPPAERSAGNDAVGGLEALPLSRLDQAVADAAARIEALSAVSDEQIRRAERAEEQAAALERELALCEARLAVETRHAAGLAAQASHLMAIAIEAQALPAADLTGDEATKGRLAQIYDDAFDAKGAELGIDEPVRFREA